MVKFQVMVREKGDCQDHRDGTVVEGVAEACTFRVSRVLAKRQVVIHVHIGCIQCACVYTSRIIVDIILSSLLQDATDE